MTTEEGQAVPILPYLEGLDYGVGVNSLDGAVRGDGVNRTEPQAVTGAAGQTATFHLDRIDSIEDLQKAMSVHVDASASYGVYGGSASVDFAHSSSFHKYSVFLCVQILVTNAFRRMRDVTLTQEAGALLAAGNWTRFREQYGDQFVAGLGTGGQYVALLEFETVGQADYQSLSAKLNVHAGVPLAGFDINAGFTNTVSEAAEKHSLHIHTVQVGGVGVEQEVAPDKMIATALGFASSVKGDYGVPYTVLLLDYKTLSLPAQPNWVNLLNAQQCLDKCMEIRNALLADINNIDFIAGHQEQFVDPNVDQLNAWRQELKSGFDQVTSAASTIVNDPMVAQLPNVTWPAGFVLPTRSQGVALTVGVSTPGQPDDWGDIVRRGGRRFSGIYSSIEFQRDAGVLEVSSE